ncbi:hypothetical protein D9756_002697 [Leucocoprinus leucothites]|uniref:F-box domain-containing protein n=1 Tax=Leucocoprinus leucothites TaxID=201217 RepID=A0A8H5GCG2_9AGAR|nr:hypothetical protein D9756_002697 [Leucoagaricus leucothites]
MPTFYVSSEEYTNTPNATKCTIVPVTWVQQEDTSGMQKEVEHLDELIHRLNEDRANLLRKINSVQANTRPLPSEILSTIFQFARPPIDFSSRRTLAEFPEDITLRRDNYEPADDLQLVLGAVSYHWRQIAWQTPQLWTMISVEVYEPISDSNTAILDLYFQNARGLPVTIELDIRAQLSLLRYSDDAEERSKLLSRLEPIWTSVFVNNAHKIQKLILLGLPLEWTSSLGPNLAYCQDLTLYWPRAYDDMWERECNLSGLSQIPKLQHIGLKTFSLL